MTTADVTPQQIAWEQLTLDEAWELRRIWDETADVRLSWLAEQSGLELRDHPDSITQLWAWFLQWANRPSGLDRCPPPVWWGPPAVDTLAYQRQAGIEALCANLERLCWNRYPDLVPSVNVAARRGKTPVAPRIGLGFTSESAEGVAWPTANTVEAGQNIIFWDVPEARRLRWYSKWYRDIDLWIENKRKAQEKATRGPEATIEGIPADEAEQGGVRWSVLSGRSQQRNQDDCCDRRNRATGLQEGCCRAAGRQG